MVGQIHTWISCATCHTKMVKTSDDPEQWRCPYWNKELWRCMKDG